MIDSFGVVQYSKRLDDNTTYCILDLSGFEKYLPENYKKPLYGHHIVLVNGKLEGIREGYGEDAILKFKYEETPFYSKDKKRIMLNVIDFYGELGDFRERLTLTRKRKGIDWHISIGYKND